MNPFERGYVLSRLEAIETIETMELVTEKYVTLTDKEIIEFANDIIRDHIKLLSE